MTDEATFPVRCLTLRLPLPLPFGRYTYTLKCNTVTEWRTATATELCCLLAKYKNVNFAAYCLRRFMWIQEDAPCSHTAVHGLHVETVPCDHYTVVRWIELIQTPSRRGSEVCHVHTDRHCAADCTGHGVSSVCWLRFVCMSAVAVVLSM